NASGTFTNKNAGSSKTVIVGGLSLGGADKGNYTVNLTTATASITAKTISLSGIGVVDKVYDGTTSATVHTEIAHLVGVLPADAGTGSLENGTGHLDTKDAGTVKTVVIPNDLSIRSPY